MGQPHSADDYLETIYFLAFPVGEYGPVVRETPPLAARVAEMLNVTLASASEMLKRLEVEGLVERGERKEALLTPKGRRAAERIARRHRLVERFLTDFMGYTPAESHEQADRMGDAFTDEMIERIAARLGDPERCPHGWPIDPAAEQEENRDLAALADLPPGTRATIVRLAEHDGVLLRWLYDEGLTPGTTIDVRSRQEAAGQITAAVGGGERTLSEKGASGVFVRAA